MHLFLFVPLCCARPPSSVIDQQEHETNICPPFTAALVGVAMCTAFPVLDIYILCYGENLQPCPLRVITKVHRRIA